MRPSRLNAIGVLVLLVGLISAVLLYRQEQPATQATPGGWQDTTLPLTDSKANTRDIEMYGGKLEVLMVQWLDWLQRPAARAILVAVSATLIALGCFHASAFTKTKR